MDCGCQFDKNKKIRKYFDFRAPKKLPALNFKKFKNSKIQKFKNFGGTLFCFQIQKNTALARLCSLGDFFSSNGTKKMRNAILLIALYFDISQNFECT